MTNLNKKKKKKLSMSTLGLKILNKKYNFQFFTLLVMDTMF